MFINIEILRKNAVYVRNIKAVQIIKTLTNLKKVKSRSLMVEHSGIEPLTSTLPVWRSPEISGMHPHKTQPPHMWIYLLSCREFI